MINFMSFQQYISLSLQQIQLVRVFHYSRNSIYLMTVIFPQVFLTFDEF